MAEFRDVENFSVADSVKRLKFERRGDGIYPIIVNKTEIPLSGLLLIDGQRFWVKVPGNGSVKLPAYDYEKIVLVDEHVTI